MAELSEAQTRLWFLDQLNPGDASYHLPDAWYIRGPLNVAALRRAVAALIDRHAGLNSRFVQVDGVPVRLPALARARLDEVVCTGIEQAAALVSELATRRFDLAAGPMIRATLIRLGDDDHLLSVVMHHIAADGWSMQILRRELSALYQAFDTGTESTLPELPIAYGDHVRRRRAAPPDAGGFAYWTSMLAGAPALELPTDRPRPPVRAGRGDSYAFDIPKPLLDGLSTLARAERCTPFTVLLAAYQVLLCRHSGQPDICVGVPVLGRDDPDTEGVIGYFAETLVLRGDLSGDPAFRDHLRATWRRLLGTFSHRSVPFEQLLAATPGRDRSRTPIFQAMLMHLRQDGDRPRFGDLDVEIVDDPLGFAKTDIELDVIEGENAALGRFTFDSALFTTATIERLARHLLVLLADVVARPGARLSELEILSGAERAALLGMWNDTAIDGLPGLVPEMFAARVAAAPDAVALTFDGQDVTYRELDAEADRVAALVHGRGPLIAVSLHRGPEMVAALLGVWRAGAAYLPLDPAYPAHRIAVVLEDSGAGVVLTSATLADRFTGPIVLIDTVPDMTVPAAVTSGDDPAYVLYTSGSTGRPKGVVVPHRALAAFLHAMAALLGPQQDRSWLALTSLSFDISGLELYLPLSRGGRVVIAGEDEARDGAALIRLIEASGVTDVQATPSGWRLLLEAGFHAPSVDALIGGEALPLPLATELRAKVRRLINVYGPTETTIWSAAWTVPPRPRSVSIGGPIAGTRLHVLDRHGGLVPVGVAGELCIAGDGVAHGYLGRPGLTAERFVPDPYGPPGSRFYRTGDRVRRLADGRIEFLGRTDNQVKLRGHRIELGEIEAVLATHPDVRAAAVIVRDETLIAYVVTEAAEDDLLTHARAALPLYMVPGTVMILDELPLTPNGKVDRTALPAADRPRRDAHTPPRTPAEKRVADVYAQVLGVEPVGAYDDFFALGGHSLLAAKVIARIGRIAVRELFDHPTVAGFAARLGDVEHPAALPITARPAGAIVRLSPAQLRLWHLQALDPDDGSYNMYNVLRLRGKLDREALFGAVGDLIARHETLRTRYPAVDGVPATELVEAPGVECVDATFGTVATLVSERTNAPFDLTAAPPLRVGLFRIADDDHVLCIVLHHIAGDGWSLNLLRDDLAALYAADLDGAQPLPPVLGFGDVVADLTGGSDDDFHYWREQLADPTPLALPVDRAPAEDGVRHGTRHLTRLPADVADAVDRAAAAHRTTTFTVLLAAYQLLLSRWSGQRDIPVGSVLAGRDRAEYEPIVGYFATTVVLRGDLTGDPTAGELIDRVRGTVLAAMAHPQMPLERLTAALGPGEPLFRTMFILHSQDVGAATGTFADLSMEFFDAGYQQVKYDLMVEAWRDHDGLALQFGYDRELFEPATITALSDQFHQLCTALSGEADRLLSTIILGESPCR